MVVAERALLLRLLRARTDPPDDADDLWQELWLKVAIVPVGPVADPLAFVCRVAINLASDRRRAKLRTAMRDVAWRDLQSGDGDAPGAARELEARDELRRIEAAIAAMPGRTRDALRRFRIDGVSQREIAHEMGISVSGVEKLLRRAYRLLDEARAGTDDDAGAGAGADARAQRRLSGEGASTT